MEKVSILLVSVDIQSAGNWPIPLRLRIPNNGLWIWNVPMSVNEGMYRIIVHSSAQVSSISGAFNIHSDSPPSFPDRPKSVCPSHTSSHYEISVRVPASNIQDGHFIDLFRQELASILEIDTDCISLVPKIVGDFILFQTTIKSDHCLTLTNLWNSNENSNEHSKGNSKGESKFMQGLVLQKVTNVTLLHNGCEQVKNSKWIWIMSLGLAPTAMFVFYGRRKWIQQSSEEGSEQEMEVETEYGKESIPMGILQDGKGKFSPYLVSPESLKDGYSQSSQSPRSNGGRIITKNWSIRKLSHSREGSNQTEYSSGKYLGNSVDISSDDEILHSIQEDASVSSDSISPFWDLP